MFDVPRPYTLLIASPVPPRHPPSIIYQEGALEMDKWVIFGCCSVLIHMHFTPLAVSSGTGKPRLLHESALRADLFAQLLFSWLAAQ